MRKMAKIMSVLRATFQFNAQNYAGTILSIWFSVRLWSSTVADCCIKTSPEGVDFVAVALKIWIILEHESDLKNFLKHAVAKEYISVSYTYFSHEEISWMFSYPYFRNNCFIVQIVLLWLVQFKWTWSQFYCCCFSYGGYVADSQKF